MLKYDFCLKTRDGQTLEHIVIGGLDQSDAERKLRQMYRHCEIMRCDVRGSVMRPGRTIVADKTLSLSR